MPKQTTVPIHVPTLLACALFASKDETRFYLNGVFVEAREGGVFYCATDGHRLLARFIEDEDVKVSDFLIIPTRVCKSWKPDAEQPFGNLTFGAREASIFYDEITISFEPVQGTFPNVASVVPGDLSGEPAQFNGFYVADFDKVAKIIGAGSAPVVHYNGSGPAAVSFILPDIIGVLMPMKKDDRDFERPNWMDRLKGTSGDMPPHDPETGEVQEPDSPKFENLDRVAKDITKSFGTPTPLTEEEKAKGYTAAFVDKKGHRTSIGLKEAMT